MTILANELRINGSITDVSLIQVADRRITIKGKFHSNQHKVFEIPYLKASVGYFGLAQPTTTNFFSSWLPNIIRHGHGIRSVNEFSLHLTAELNAQVNKSFLRNNASGFHLCGLAEDNIPEFYFIRNIAGMDGFYYKAFTDTYICTEDFRARDAITTKEGQARDITSLRNGIFWYVNGDLRSFWDFWMPATQFIDSLRQKPEFPALSSDLERAKWKLKVIAQLYEKYATQKIVGGPIDGIEIKP